MPIQERYGAVLSTMADGIGDLSFASPEWVEAAREALGAEAGKHAAGLDDLGQFTLCEVAHNPPAYLRCGSSLAWHARFVGSKVVRELPCPIPPC